MEVTIDDSPAPDLVSAEAGETFGQVFGRIMAGLRKQGRTVTAVQIDGRPLDEETADRVRERPVGEIGRLALTTADVSHVVGGLLSEIESSLTRLGLVAERVSRLFQSGDTKPALELTQEFIEAWQTLMEGIAQAARLGSRRLDEQRVGDESATVRLKAVADVLRELVGAFERKDFVSVGDAFAYDLPEQIESLREIVAGMNEGP